jgi:plasmid stabilization system protein ParE
MRRIVRFRTYLAQLQVFVEQSAEAFGASVAERIVQRIDRAIEQALATYPRTSIDADLGLYTYYVAKTPYTLIYHFDDVELRLHFIVPARADRRRIDPKAAEWAE